MKWHTVRLTDQQLEDLWWYVRQRKTALSWHLSDLSKREIEQDIDGSKDALKIIQQIQRKLVPCLEKDDSIMAESYLVQHEEEVNG